MDSFIMRWPELDIEVRCKNLTVNKRAFDAFIANLPIQAVQGHEMTGGWLIRYRAIHFKKHSFDVPESDLKGEPMNQAPKGCVALLFPLAGNAELVVKYDDCVDNRTYIPIAQVVAADLPKLLKAGQAQWKSATSSKEIILTKFVSEEESQS